MVLTFVLKLGETFLKHNQGSFNNTQLWKLHSRQVLKSVQSKGDMQYASSLKGVTHLWCTLPSSLNNIYFPSRYLFCITLELRLVTKINLILLFQKAVPVAVHFSRFQGMGSDVFCLLVHSICFTSFRSLYIMIVVALSSVCLFQVTAWSKQDLQLTIKKIKKHQCDLLYWLSTYFWLENCLLLLIGYIKASK